MQTCDASQIQTIPKRNNTAVVLQVIISQNPPSPQDGTQVVKLRQTALGTGSNTAGIAQYVKQSLGPGTPEDTEEGDGTGRDDVSQTVSCPLAISGGKAKGPGVIGS